MALIFLDFETYYDKEYSLRKMTPAEYILDDRFEVTCVAVKVGEQPAQIVSAEEFPKFLARFDPAHTATVTFNALFDSCILAWRYGYVPSLMLDAMGMARALLGHKLERFSLEYVARHLHLGGKAGGGDPLKQAIGLHREQIVENFDLWREYTEYALRDVELLFGIYQRLEPDFPDSERTVMDLVLRCAVEPKFVLDEKLIVQHIMDLKEEKLNLLRACGLQYNENGRVPELMSVPKFAAELTARGVEIVTKPSPSNPNNQIPAFAKTDEFMRDLLEHEDTQVQALAAARLGLKSTIEETRSSTLLRVAQLPWARYRAGNDNSMPVPLRYGAAHTHRLGGEWKMNMQNLPTARGSGGKSKLRHALQAPSGYMVLVADLGQIEARLAAYFCGCNKLLTQFKEKLDPYARLASKIFGFEVDRKVHKFEGFVGKTGILGLQYGCGRNKFYNMVRMQGRGFGIDVSRFTEELATKAVYTYREEYSEMPDTWSELDLALRSSWCGNGLSQFRCGVSVEYEIVFLPNGLSLNYADPEWDNGEFRYRYGRQTYKLYGAKLLENITQALARIVVMDAALRIKERTGLGFSLQAHDELVYIIPEQVIDVMSEIVQCEMIRPPAWAPDVPLSAEYGIGKTYGDAK